MYPSPHPNSPTASQAILVADFGIELRETTIRGAQCFVIRSALDESRVDDLLAGRHTDATAVRDKQSQMDAFGMIVLAIIDAAGGKMGEAELRGHLGRLGCAEPDASNAKKEPKKKKLYVDDPQRQRRAKKSKGMIMASTLPLGKRKCLYVSLACMYLW